MTATDSHDDGNVSTTGGEHRVQDPVCGMDVDPHGTARHVEHAGTTYYFCSKHCQASFEADPAPYVFRSGSEGPQQSAAGEVVEYTCPMHPEIRQPGPGACPICGMALEPVMVTADGGPGPELRDMTRRFRLATARR